MNGKRKGKPYPRKFRAEIELAEAESLLAAIPDGVTYADFYRLIDAVLVAKAEMRRHAEHVPLIDRAAQLRAMLRLGDDDLITALRSTDTATLHAIDQAQADEISAILWRDGVFVDVAGDEYRIPPAIEHVGRDERVRPYLPAGIEGLRRSIKSALDAIEESSDAAGNRVKEWQTALAAECMRIWRKYGGASRQSIWCRGDKCSPNVTFAAAVFAVAVVPGVVDKPPGDKRIATILKLSD